MENGKTPQAAPAEVFIGGKYRVVRLLGKGGMGAVYEAENTFTRKRVAVKVMRPEVAASEIFAQRFLREAQAASRLEHPNIVYVLDMGRGDDGSLYIVQEYLTGHDLGKHLEAAGRLSAGEALKILVPVMEALVVAHAHGIVHRDLKPDNIFLAETPRGVVPKLIDFGIAKVSDAADGQKITVTATQMGTPYYMSPEQALGDSDLDARSDVWSLGVVLYELLAGERPYSAPPRSSANALMAKIIYEEPRELAAVAPDLPVGLPAVVMGSLRKQRDERYPTMQAFLDAVQGWAGAAGVEPSRAVAVSVPVPVSVPTVVTASLAPSGVDRELTGGTLLPMEHTLSVRPARRGPRRVALGLGVLGVGALLAWGVFHHGAATVPASQSAAMHATLPVTAMTLDPPRTPVEQPAVEAVPPTVRPDPVVVAPTEAVDAGVDTLNGLAERTHPTAGGSHGHSLERPLERRGGRRPTVGPVPTEQPRVAAPTHAPTHAPAVAPPSTSNGVGNM